MAEPRMVYRHRVRSARSWPGLGPEGWWPEDTVSCLSISEGCGRIIGDGKFVGHAGDGWPLYTELGVQPQTAVIDPADYERLRGQYLRVDLATVELPTQDAHWVPIWWGVVTQVEITPDGSAEAPGGDVSIMGRALADVLDTVQTVGGQELATDGSTLQPTIDIPGMNVLPGGDCSTTPVDLVWDRSCHVWDRSGNGQPWTCRRAAQTLLALCGRPYDGGTALPWVMDDLYASDSHLDRELPAMELAGKSVAQALTDVLGPAMSWRAVVVNGVPTIQIFDADGLFLANTVDLDGSAYIDAVRLSTLSGSADQAIAVGDRPIEVVTVGDDGNTGGSLIPDGWSYSDSPATHPRAWRVWKLNPQWDGSTWNGADGVRNQVDPDDPTQRVWSAPIPPPAGLELQRDLPMTLERDGSEAVERCPPIVVVGSGSSWADLSDSYQPSIASGGRIVLTSDPEAAQRLKGLVSGGKTLLVTIAVRAWAPLVSRVSRAQGEWPRDVPRQVRASFQYRQTRIAAGCVLGVNGAALETAATELFTADQSAALEAAAQGLAARWVTDHRAVSWTDRGTIDYGGALRPGANLRQVTIQGRTITMTALVTRRTWNLTAEDYGTTYESEPLRPGDMVAG